MQTRHIPNQSGIYSGFHVCCTLFHQHRWTWCLDSFSILKVFWDFSRMSYTENHKSKNSGIESQKHFFKTKRKKKKKKKSSYSQVSLTSLFLCVTHLSVLACPDTLNEVSAGKHKASQLITNYLKIIIIKNPVTLLSTLPFFRVANRKGNQLKV